VIACVDVGYHDPHAVAACVVFEHWTDDTPHAAFTVRIDTVEPYEPGQFYRREQPCLLRVLADVEVPLDTIIVDGFVWLGPAQPGLGAHLHAAIEQRSAIIGVAKTAYAGNTVAVEILRGISQNPLYITAIGVDVAIAAEHVRTMHGEHRIPTLLGHVDRLSRAT
jgi:deoxyribonuclease V